MCGQCNEKYIGETYRPLHARFREHMDEARGHRVSARSAVADHHRWQHPDSQPAFTIRVAHRGRGYVYRRCLEAIEVSETNPAINRTREGRGIVNLR